MWQKSRQLSQLLISSFELQRYFGLQLQLRGELTQLYVGKKQSALGSLGPTTSVKLQQMYGPRSWLLSILCVCISTQGKAPWMSERKHAFQALADKAAAASIRPSLPKRHHGKGPRLLLQHQKAPVPVKMLFCISWHSLHFLLLPSHSCSAPFLLIPTPLC